MWVIITANHNSLLPHRRSFFSLDYTQTSLIAQVWLIAYLVTSTRSALLVGHIGYKRAVAVGLGLTKMASRALVVV